MKKILIVDDKPELARIVQQFLSKHYEPVIKTNGMDAFSWLEQGNIPDLIISDINMPEMDGEEFIKQLKNSGFFSKIPVIMLSSTEETGEKVKFLKLGVEDYIVKPFNPEELELRVSKILK
jgi:two-component system, chemotaxis family, chemotaxis protein CheY